MQRKRKACKSGPALNNMADGYKRVGRPSDNGNTSTKTSLRVGKGGTDTTESEMCDVEDAQEKLPWCAEKRGADKSSEKDDRERGTVLWMRLLFLKKTAEHLNKNIEIQEQFPEVNNS